MRFLAPCFAAFFAATCAHAAYDAQVPANYVPNLVRSSPDAYFAEMNSGWRPELYGSLRGRLKPGRSYLVLHNRLPNTTLDLRSPNGFRESVFRLGLLNVPSLDQGHVMIGWSCEVDGQRFEGNTGITGEQTNQQMAMAQAGWGVTGLFSIFKDGHLQTPTLIASVIRQSVEKNQRIATLAFEVKPEQCRSMLTFLKNFLSHENQPWKRFGLNANPLKFEGGGCGSFGASALSTAGFPSADVPWRVLKVNRGAFGFGIPNPSPDIEPFPVPHAPGERHEISALRGLLLQNWNPTSASNAVSLRVMDPEMLFLFQQTVLRASLDQVYRDSLALGRELMASPFVKPRLLQEDRWGAHGPDSGENTSVVETRVDENFDPRAALTVRTARQWLSGLRSAGYTAKGFTFNGEPAVLLSR